MKDSSNDTETGVTASSPAPIPKAASPTRISVVIGCAVLLGIAIISIVRHWHVGG